MTKPVPARIQLIPSAPYVVGRDRRAWVYDADKVINNTIGLLQDLPVDIEHSTEVKGAIGEPAPAIGWVKGVFKDNGAIWANIEWLEKGVELIASGAYRYISPVFQTLNGEILKITSVALTNQPNLYLTALNRTTYMTDPVDLSSFVPRADYDIAINRAVQAENTIKELNRLEQEKIIDTLISEAVKSGIVAPATVEYHKAQCRTDGGIQRFRDFLNVAPPVIPKVELKQTASLTDDEKQMCKFLGISQDAYLKQKGG